MPLSGGWYGGIISKPVGVYIGSGVVGIQSEKVIHRLTMSRKIVLESTQYEEHNEKQFTLFTLVIHKGIGSPHYECHFFDL